MYKFHLGQDGNFLKLTSVLLELICDWMTSDPIICLVSLYPKYSQFLHSSQKVLWTSPTKPNTQTAVPGLVKWCIRAPFLKLSSQNVKVRMDYLQTVYYYFDY